MSSTSAATALELHNQKVVSDGRKQFCAATSEHLLDYKHNNPHHIVNASTMLIKIFSNVVENPSEEKFRKVKASSNAYKNNIAFIRGGDELMVLAGWRSRVADMEKYWMFEYPATDVKFSILAECLDVLRKSLSTMEDKARRADAERAAKMNKGKEERERVLLAIQDDALERRMRAEVTHISAASVKATPLPSEVPARSGSERGGPHAPHGGMPGSSGMGAGMDADDDDDEEEEPVAGGGVVGSSAFAGKGQRLSSADEPAAAAGQQGAEDGQPQEPKKHK